MGIRFLEGLSDRQIAERVCERAATDPQRWQLTGIIDRCVSVRGAKTYVSDVRHLAGVGDPARRSPPTASSARHFTCPGQRATCIACVRCPVPSNAYAGGQPPGTALEAARAGAMKNPKDPEVLCSKHCADWGEDHAWHNRGDCRYLDPPRDKGQGQGPPLAHGRRRRRSGRWRQKGSVNANNAP